MQPLQQTLIPVPGDKLRSPDSLTFRWLGLKQRIHPDISLKYEYPRVGQSKYQAQISQSLCRNTSRKRLVNAIQTRLDPRSNNRYADVSLRVLAYNRGKQVLSESKLSLFFNRILLKFDYKYYEF